MHGIYSRSLASHSAVVGICLPCELYPSHGPYWCLCCLHRHPRVGPRRGIHAGFPYDRRSKAGFYLGFFQDFMERAQGLRRAESAATDLCWVACGRLDGFWEWKLHPWDTAAGALIVREAGGTVSDFRGGPFDPHGEQTLASNGLVHDAMVRVLEMRLDRA